MEPSTLLPPTINRKIISRLVSAETIEAESTTVNGQKYFAPHAFPDLPEGTEVVGVSANAERGYYVFILTHPSFEEIK